MTRPTFTVPELESGAALADKLIADVGHVVNEASDSKEAMIHGVHRSEIVHGSWAINERRYWKDVGRRFRNMVTSMRRTEAAPVIVETENTQKQKPDQKAKVKHEST